MSFKSIVEGKGLPDRVVRSPVESDRFGLSIGRLELGSTGGTEPQQVRGLVAASEVDIVVLRYEASSYDWFARLLDPSYVAIHADTLVYYGAPIDPDRIPPPDVHFLARAAGAEDRDTVDAAVRGIFTQYGNHYAANPLLDRLAALEGYCEWAAGFIATPGRETLLLESSEDHELAGLATLLVEEPGEVVLAGVEESFRGRGVYQELLRRAEAGLADAGCRQIHVSTQIHNVAVIRAWVNLGYRFELALQTVHLIRRELWAGEVLNGL
ncbi:MAG: GNAT family N-acetyltransferase [Acidimicrobiales bacterium]|jgi:ribosomal protein S18 acetylase RimI-like enzyme|nr:GNAT family N-acetyltransferase [Acidimicrobiales bacterium]